MSWVTNVMLSVTMYDTDNAKEFAAWIRDRPQEYLRRESYHPALANPWPDDQEWPGPYIGGLAESPVSAWSGTKYPECHVWLGVLNTADLGKVRERFAAVPWRMPNAVQLFLMDQEESFFRVWMLRDGAPVEVPMPGPYEEDDEFWSAWFRDQHPGV